MTLKKTTADRIAKMFRHRADEEREQAKGFSRFLDPLDPKTPLLVNIINGCLQQAEKYDAEAVIFETERAGQEWSLDPESVGAEERRILWPKP
ncbi:MAG: hypothetical protein JST30_01735 [Armatimonadetes bacterium]|nr:hypothetical protein [Armatimonadota bacterium]